MAEKTTPFVINDRRKFTSEGELRHDSASPSTANASDAPSAQAASTRTTAETIPFPSAMSPTEASQDDTPLAGTESHDPSAPASETVGEQDDELPPAPTAEQSAEAERAYAATVDRLDTAIRASNPGADRIPEMSFERFVQSLYMQSIFQLGGGAETGQQPQIDIIGARQTIDMLAILEKKTKGNLGPAEQNLLQSAVFEARMGFLEVTQAIARQAAGRQPGGTGTPLGGPSVVR